MENEKKLEPGQMRVKVEVNGEFVSTTVNKGDTIQALFDEGHLRGIEVNNVRINGKPATSKSVLEDKDTVQGVPTGGKLA